jgi:yecA family protein
MRAIRAERLPDIQVPNIEEAGLRPFGQPEMRALVEWTRRSEWPDGCLDIHELEGLLCSLLLLPLALRPGVWLPYLWKDRGWRVPDLLRSGHNFAEFLELVMGFMRAHDARLLAQPPAFVSVLDATEFHVRGETAQSRLRRWMRGFSLLIEQSGNFQSNPPADLRRLLFAFAALGNPALEQTARQGGAALPLRECVLGLSALRSSRGPLGPLAGVPPKDKTPRARGAGR